MYVLTQKRACTSHNSLFRQLEPAGIDGTKLVVGLASILRGRETAQAGAIETPRSRLLSRGLLIRLLLRAFGDSATGTLIRPVSPSDHPALAALFRPTERTV